MGYFVVIRKIEDAEDFSRYSYGPDESEFGVLKIIKKSGEIIEEKEYHGDQTGAYFARAKRKMYLHWKDGELPEETCWAS